MAYDDLRRIPTEPLLPSPSVEIAGPGAAPILAERLADLTDELEGWPGALHQLGETQLTQFVATMLRLSVRAESLAAAATAEAVQRGVVASSQATDAAGWVAQVAAGTEPVVARRVGVVAAGCADPRNQRVTDAVATGAVSVGCAYIALREAPKVLPVIPNAEREEILSWYLALSDSGSRSLRGLTTRIIGRFAPDELVREEERQQACESLRWSDLPNGLTQLVAELSTGHAAEVKHAIAALAAPAPSACTPAVDVVPSEVHPAELGAIEMRDTRTPGKRRADAFVRLAQTAAELIDGGRSRTVSDVTGTAKVVVFVDHNTLIDQLGAADRLPGLGQSIDGELLDAGTVRRLACDAEIIPMVLGLKSEPLDVGRGRRLFSGALRTAVIARDQHCTFPECGRPPDWCDAHHVNPWWAGGATSLENAALLCARHHTIVHRDLLTAQVTSSGVTWDRTPGQMPERMSA